MASVPVYLVVVYRGFAHAWSMQGAVGFLKRKRHTTTTASNTTTITTTNNHDNKYNNNNNQHTTTNTTITTTNTRQRQQPTTTTTNTTITTTNNNNTDNDNNNTRSYSNTTTKQAKGFDAPACHAQRKSQHADPPESGQQRRSLWCCAHDHERNKRHTPQGELEQLGLGPGWWLEGLHRQQWQKLPYKISNVEECNHYNLWEEMVKRDVDCGSRAQ
jgi:hypothetical protein